MLDLKKIFGSTNDRKVKAMLARVARINAFEPRMKALSDDQLRAKTEEFRTRLAGGEVKLRGRSLTVGMVVHSIRNPLYADILDGLTAVLSAQGYRVVLGVSGQAPGAQEATAHSLVDRAMDALVLVAPTLPRDQVLTLATTVPTVVIGHHDVGSEYDSVVGDDVAGAALVVDHLVALGHRRIAHTSGRASGHWLLRPERVRRDGYRKAMVAHGLRDEVNVATTSYTPDGGYAAACSLLDAREPPTAIFAGSDGAATGVMRAATERRLRVPRDLSVVGYDNTTLAALPQIALTSVDQAGRELGTAAGRLALERLDGRTRSILVSESPELFVRLTTARPRA